MVSTTRVDFYVLDVAGKQSQLHFACRLAEKAYGKGINIYAHTLSAGTARQFDEMLWTFRQGSFIPHEILDGEQHHAPVRIGTQDHVMDGGELLINLAGQMPEFAQQFARVAEVITGDPEAKRAGRERYKQYKALGIEPDTHVIGS